MPMLWAGPSLGDVRIKAVSAAYALYHAASGQTHIIGDEARAILEALADGPLCAADILAKLALQYDLDVGDAGTPKGGEAVLTGRLRALEELGLVRPWLG